MKWPWVSRAKYDELQSRFDTEIASKDARIEELDLIARSQHERLLRNSERLRGDDETIRNLESFLRADPLPIENNAFQGTWQANYAMTRYALGLRRGGLISLERDASMDALIFRILVPGRRQDLIDTMERFVWSMQHLLHSIKHGKVEGPFRS